MELEKTFDHISNWYGDALSKHNIDSKSVGWKDEQSQLLRFDKLFQLIKPNEFNLPIEINDYGAGYGAMFKYLTMKLPQLKKYYGYEINEKMIEAGEHYLNDDRVKYFQSSVIKTEVDFSFVSGTFNLRGDLSNEKWSAYIQETLIKLFESSKIGFAFNCLTTFVDWQQNDLFYANPTEYFSFCKNELSKYVTLIHDYPLYEWTILVRKV